MTKREKYLKFNNKSKRDLVGVIWVMCVKFSAKDLCSAWTGSETEIEGI